MKEYTIIEAYDSEELDEGVNNYLRGGWELVGGHKHTMAVDDDEAFSVWSQTMVKG